MSIGRIGVAGAGTMGAGIAQLACMGRFETYLHDPDPTRSGRRRRATPRGARPRHRARSLERRRGTRRRPRGFARRRSADDLADCELVIEAAPEDLALKREPLGPPGRAVRPGRDPRHQHLLPVGDRDRRRGRAARARLRHALLQPPAGDAPGRGGGGRSRHPEETLATVDDVARTMGREPIRAADRIGFVANRVARPFTLEALRLLGQRVAPHDQIDRIVRLGGGFRMGPFELMDLIGVDVNLEVAKSFWEQSFHEPRWQPHPIQAADGGRGPSGSKGRARLLRVRRRATPPRRSSPSSRLARRRRPDPEVRSRATASGPSASGACRPRRLDPAGDAIGYVALPTLGRVAARGDRRWPGDERGRARGREATLRPSSESTWSRRDRHSGPGPRTDPLPDRQRGPFRGRGGRRDSRRRRHGDAPRLQLAPRARSSGAEAIGPIRVVACLDALRAELGEERYRVAPDFAPRPSGIADRAGPNTFCGGRRRQLRRGPVPGDGTLDRSRSRCRHRRRSARPATAASSSPSPTTGRRSGTADRAGSDRRAPSP